MASRRQLILLAAAGAIAPFAARSQARKAYRIGVLETTSLRLNAENMERFRKGMEERG